MKSTITKRPWVILASVCMLLIGCSSNNQPAQTKIEGVITASSHINPDLSGGYRPVNIKLFFLKNDASFKRSDFMQLYSNPDVTLGDELVFVLNKQVLPGQTIKLEENVPQGTRYIGAVAAFRALEDSHWRDIKPVPEKCWSCRGAGLWNPVNVDIDQLNIKVSLED